MSRRGIPSRLYVEDMLRYSEYIAAFTANSTRHAFREDVRTQLAVARALEVIGEAAKRLLDTAPEPGSLLAELPLRAVYETRNRLIHGYDTLDVEVLWDISVSDIPQLQQQLESVLGRWPDTPASPGTPV